jgi:alkylhydroperoxidase family enzyme
MQDDPTTPTPCPPLTDAAWPAEIDDLRTGFAGALNVYRVMAHHPPLLAAWAPLRAHVVQHSALGPERAEIVILRTGHRLGTPYEWAHHVSRARALGLADARIASVAGPPAAMAPEDALLAQAVDALFDGRGLPAGLERDLAGRFGRGAVFDLIATVGFYSTLGYLLNTYDPPLDDAVAAELAARPLRG